MKTFTIYGQITVSCHTVVEAETEEEARELAAERMVKDLCHSCSSGEDEEWVIDTDGEPQIQVVDES